MKARGRSEEPQPRAAAARPYKRDPSTSSLGTEVRCACQFFQTDSLLPERAALQRSSRPASRTRMATTIGDHEYEPISPPPAESKLADSGKLAATEVKVSDADKASEKHGPTLPTAKSFDDDVEMELAAADGAGGKDVSDTSSIDSRERRFLRVPLDDELVVPGDGDTEEAVMTGKELGDSNNEGARYIATPTPTTTESRTDCELNTSQVDSSGLEDLPLKRDARKRMTAEEEVTNGRPFHQRIKSQAGRIRTKLRNISRPKFSMPDRPRFSLPERPKFNLPERPKFSLPERPKIHLPERPKINLPERPKTNPPERPKINLPDRPKFSFPERPRFNLPERPKFHMPQRPKFSMPSISSARSTAPKKTTSSTRRPLRDKVSTESSASSQKKFFDFDFKSYPRLFERKKHDFATSSPKGGRAMTPPLPKSRKKGPIGSRWLHRFSDIKYADDENRPELGDDESEGGPPGERIRVLRDVHISDSERDDMEDQIDSGNTESTTAFRDKDYGYAISVEQPQASPALDKSKSERSIESAASDREQRSSGSSSDRRRAGVLEEIDSDEFFLREKGISQEDVAVGRYLTSEIRDAFRSPVSALTKMTGSSFESEGGDQMARQYRGNKMTGDSFESEGGDQMARQYRGNKMTGDSFESEATSEQLALQYRGTPEREPSRPARTRSLHGRKRGSGKSRSPSEEVVVASEDISYNTFPPTRPKRNRRIRDDALQQDETEETAADEIPTPRVQPDAPTFTLTGPQDSVEQPPSEDTDEHWGMEVEDDQPLPEPAPLPEPPQAPKRKRRSRKDLTNILPSPARYDDEDFNDSIEVRYTGGSDEKLNAENQYVNGHIEDEVMEKGSFNRDEAVKAILNGHYTKEDWLDSVQSSGTRDEQVALRAEPDYIIPVAPYEGNGTPVAPKRGRRKGSRGTSLADEDRTSRAASTLPSEHGGDVEVEPEADAELELEAEVGGYASVTARPERPRRPKATVPAVPGRRRRSLGHANGNRPSHFFSLPRRAMRAPPVRPVRNYSTLGPSRPPRRTKALSQATLEHEYVEQDTKNEPYVEIEEDAPHSRAEESQESNRDLQSGDIIEKMKGRPLPAPPRPPRKTREGREAHEEPKPEDAEIDIEDVEEALGALNDDAFFTHKASSVQLLEQEGLLKAPLDKSADEDLEEASVATQTDPLPDDLCVEAAVEEPPTFADASTETNGKLPSPPLLEETPTLVPEPPSAPEPEPEKVSKPEVIEETAVKRVETVYREPPVVHEETPKRPEPTAPRPPTPPQPIIIEKPIPYYVMPDPDTEIELKAQRLQVAELDVERLNVGELQAQKILVSDIDGVTMQVTELTSKSGNLVVNNIELPSGFLQDLYDALPHPPSAPTIPAVSTSPETQATPTTVTTTPSVPPVQVPITAAAQEAKVEAPSIPPLPSVQHLQSVPPHEHVHPFIPEYMPPRAASRPRSHISASQRDLESEEEMISLMPSPPSRRRRHHASSKPPVVRYSSDEEEEDEYHPTPPSRRHLSRGGAPGDQQPVVELGRQLVQACQGAVMRAVRQSLLYASSRLQEGEDGRRDLQTLLCILLVMVAALILLGFGSGKTFHHHHWDYLFPPPAP